ETLLRQLFDRCDERVDSFGESIVPFGVEPGRHLRPVMDHVPREGNRFSIATNDVRQAPRRVTRSFNALNLVTAPLEDLVPRERSVERDWTARRPGIARSVDRVLVPQLRMPLPKLNRIFEQLLLGPGGGDLRLAPVDALH